MDDFVRIGFVILAGAAFLLCHILASYAEKSVGKEREDSRNDEESTANGETYIEES